MEQACYWLAARRTNPTGPLTGDSRSDIAIVGAGLTGLWTAIFLKQMDPAVSVVILEQETAGYGASGRNAGIVSETLDHSHELAVAHFGEAEARELARLGRENLDELERFLAEKGIDAEFVREGQLVMALTPAHVAELEASASFAGRLGIHDWRFLSAKEAREEVDSPLFLGALRMPRSGVLHPIKLLEGLRSEAMRSGVRLFERTAVRSILPSEKGVEIRLSRGTVVSEKAVL
ncbi:MAG TPA: FAD-dependent oxidoreductase, partial [Thermoanaerobaculia bacterium]